MSTIPNPDTEHHFVPCPACGGDDMKLLYRKFNAPIAQCTACGMVMPNPRIPHDYIRQRYSEAYFWNEYLPAQGIHTPNEFDPQYYDKRYAPLLELIRHNSPSGQTLFEIGVGSGFFLKAAERAGWHVSGSDISAASIAFARETLHLDTHPWSAEDLATHLPSGTIDVVVMLDVIEHLLDAHAALTAIHRLLSPDGILVILTPNLNSFSYFALKEDWAIISPAEHTYNFSERTLKRTLHRAGFPTVNFKHRTYADFRLSGTMNHRNTHAPSSLRTKAYRLFVRIFGPFALPFVKAFGLGDVLLAIAHKSAPR